METADRSQTQVRVRTLLTPQAAVRISDTGGPGFPLLMLHGLSCSRIVFAHQLASPELRRAARILTIDFPGHGDSQNAHDPANAYTTSGMADCVASVLRQLRVERAAVYGWSLGGHVAIELMARTSIVAGLMLTGAPPIPPGVIGVLRGFHVSIDMLLATKEVFSEREAQHFATLCFGVDPNSAFVAAVRRADGRARPIFAHSLLSGTGVDRRAAVQNAGIPIAFVNGADDPFIRASYFSSLQVPTLQPSESAVIPGTGHTPFWNQPERFMPLLARFIARVASAPRGAVSKPTAS
jgi:pimeloyl-ACP methyl ester carboxylesterase